jgi:hypothetical protein
MEPGSRNRLAAVAWPRGARRLVLGYYVAVGRRGYGATEIVIVQRLPPMCAVPLAKPC